MARTQLTVQTIGRNTQLTPSYGAVDSVNGNYFDNSGNRTFLHVKNGSGSPLVMTIQTPNQIDGNLAIADLDITIPAGEERMVGPFTSGDFHTADPGATITTAINVDWDASTSITVAVIKLPAAVSGQ